MRQLQDILNDVPFETLPAAWTTFDLAAFSVSKQLWRYQRAALENALKALWKYYEDFADYRPGEGQDAASERKRGFFRWYQDNGLKADLDIPVSSARLRRLLEEYYPVQDGRIAYEHFINRLGFWMATGSGKTLVIVKLLELLWRLIRRGEIPPHDILVLTHRDDLLAQLRLHVAEFNRAPGDLFIRLRDLRDYPEIKRETPTLFREQELTVFCYRSDNLSDEQKEKIVDFRNYDNFGQWYILLDEAHKGDKEESKRQHIYSTLARHGFLFNFSATFTDPRDILTTAYDFNLARFIESGYGKHITVLKQENRAFGRDEDYTNTEKQKVVLKSLLMLALARHALDNVTDAAGMNDLYHRPLLLTLVNSVTKKDADLELFFRELERIGKGEIGGHVWQQAIDELCAELREQPELIFERERFVADETFLREVTLQDVLASIYNAPAPAEIEVLVRPSNRQELAFKLKSADRPFALIKIGDISGWLKEQLAGYEIVEGFEDEAFFERLNADDSDINILMGSRAFYEGWDSNRPNVITFINIGTGTDARKFILQSIGRGVRIEPLKNKRQRLLALHNTGEFEADLFQRIKEHILPLETLFIFGTNRNALLTVIQELDLQKGKEDEHELALAVNEEAVEGRTLLIPVYRSTNRPLIQHLEPRKFPIPGSELNLLQGYVDYLGDDRLLLAHHNATPRQIASLRRSLEQTQRYFNTGDSKRYGNLNLILPRLFTYFDIVPQMVDSLKPLENEIRHFRHVRVTLKDISELQASIQQVTQYPERSRELREKLIGQQLTLDLFEQVRTQIQALRDKDIVRVNGQSLDIRRLANHYYVPIIMTDDARADYIRHVIKTPSEVRFVKRLGDYLNPAGNHFGQFDWWAFSKLDETLDDVYLPYYDPDANRLRQFKPDFIFWLQKADQYFIVFVDPKGIQQTGYQHKIDGYEQLFLDTTKSVQTFTYKDTRVQIHLLLYTDDANLVPQGYRPYWFDNFADFTGRLIGA